MSEMPLLETYSQAEAWLLSMTDYERLLGSGSVRYDTRTFDLDNFRTQLARLGDPHLRYGVIHVAGTKGKGSTCAFLESALRHCGFRTGLYTSPHLFRFTERIRINGSEISDNDFCRLLEKTGRMMTADAESPGADNGRSFRTVFEILTATAFEYFAEQKVDVAIIETGLGGRLDSTNMFDKPGAAGPLIDVITAIGLDHTAILGDSIARIAGEKAGIIRSHARTVVSPQSSAETMSVVREVVETRCRTVAATPPVMVSDVCAVEPGGVGENCYTFRVNSGASRGTTLGASLAEGMRICPSLHGAHQAANVAAVLMTLLELEDALVQRCGEARPSGGAWPLMEPANIRTGIEQTRWPGRFQLIDGKIPVVVDGAHCGISSAALATECGRRFGDRPVVIVTGFLTDKAGSDLLGEIFGALPVVKAIAVVPPTPRAVSAEYITQALAEYLQSDQIESAGNMADALARGQTEAAARGAYVVIFGSLYLVGPALRALKIN